MNSYNELHAVVGEKNLDSELWDFVDLFVDISKELKAPAMLTELTDD